MSIKSTIVELNVVSKKEGFKYGNKGGELETVIELAVPYDTKSVFHKLSGGTNMELRTINQDAADMFIIGETVVMTISKKEVITIQTDTTTDPLPPDPTHKA